MATSTSSTITLTDSAVAKVRSLLDAGDDPTMALRVAVRPGGCSGFSYEMYFDTAVAEDDTTCEFPTDGEPVTVVVDPSSSLLLAGATLTYRDGLEASGFSIDNPNAQRTCGCGNSFS